MWGNVSFLIFDENEEEGAFVYVDKYSKIL